MARITVDDCLKIVPNRFDLVMLAARRARQLAMGGKEPLVDSGNDKPTVTALREIEAGLMNSERLDAIERAESRAQQDAEQAAISAVLGGR